MGECLGQNSSPYLSVAKFKQWWSLSVKNQAVPDENTGTEGARTLRVPGKRRAGNGADVGQMKRTTGRRRGRFSLTAVSWGTTGCEATPSAQARRGCRQLKSSFGTGRGQPSVSISRSSAANQIQGFICKPKPQEKITSTWSLIPTLIQGSWGGGRWVPSERNKGPSLLPRSRPKWVQNPKAPLPPSAGGVWVCRVRRKLRRSSLRDPRESPILKTFREWGANGQSLGGGGKDVKVNRFLTSGEQSLPSRDSWLPFLQGTVNCLRDAPSFYHSVVTVESRRTWAVRISPLIFLSSALLSYSKSSICNKSYFLLTCLLAHFLCIQSYGDTREHTDFGYNCLAAIGRMGQATATTDGITIPTFKSHLLRANEASALGLCAKMPWESSRNRFSGIWRAQSVWRSVRVEEKMHTR